MGRMEKLAEEVISQALTGDLAEQVAEQAVEKVIEMLKDRVTPDLEAFDSAVELSLEAAHDTARSITSSVLNNASQSLQHDAFEVSRQIREMMVLSFGSGIATKAFQSAAMQAANKAAQTEAAALRESFQEVRDDLEELREFFLGAVEESRRVLHLVKANMAELKRLKGIPVE